MAALDLAGARAAATQIANTYGTQIGRRFLEAATADAWGNALDATRRNYGVSHNIQVNGRTWRAQLALNHGDPFPTVRALAVDREPASPDELADVGRALWTSVLMPAGFRLGGVVEASPNGRSKVSHFRVTTRDTDSNQLLTSTAPVAIRPVRDIPHRMFVPRAVGDDAFARGGPSDPGEFDDEAFGGYVPNQALRPDVEMAGRTFVFDFLPYNRDGAGSVTDMPACTRRWRVDMPCDNLNRCRVFALLITPTFKFALPRNAYSCAPEKVECWQPDARGSLARTDLSSGGVVAALSLTTWMQRATVAQQREFMTALAADPSYQELLKLNTLRDAEFYEQAAVLLSCRIFVYASESGEASVYGLSNQHSVRFVGSSDNHAYAVLYPAAESHYRKNFGAHAARVSGYKSLLEQKTDIRYVCVYGGCRGSFFNGARTKQCTECGEWSGLLPQSQLWALRVSSVLADGKIELECVEITRDQADIADIRDELLERAPENHYEEDEVSGCPRWTIPMVPGTIVDLKASTSASHKLGNSTRRFLGGSSNVLTATKVADLMNSSSLQEALELPKPQVDEEPTEPASEQVWLELFRACVSKSALAKGARAATRGPGKRNPEFVTLKLIERKEEEKEEEQEQEDDGHTHACVDCGERLSPILPSTCTGRLIKFPRAASGHICRINANRVKPKSFEGGVWCYDIETIRGDSSGLQIPCMVVLQRLDLASTEEIVRNSEYSASEKAPIAAAEKKMGACKKALDALEQAALLDAHTKGVTDIADLSAYLSADPRHAELKADLAAAKRELQQSSAVADERIKRWMELYEGEQAGTVILRGPDCIRQLIEYIAMRPQMRDGIIYAHNGGSFDHQYVLNEAVTLKQLCEEDAAFAEAHPDLKRMMAEDITIPTLAGTSLAHMIVWRFGGMRWCDTCCLIGPFALQGLAARMGAAGVVTKLDFDAATITPDNVEAAVKYCVRDATVLSVALARFRDVMLRTSAEVVGFGVDPLFFNSAAGYAFELATESARQNGRVMRSTESACDDLSKLTLSVMDRAQFIMERPCPDFPDVLRSEGSNYQVFMDGPLGERHVYFHMVGRLTIPIPESIWHNIMPMISSMASNGGTAADAMIVDAIRATFVPRNKRRWMPPYSGIASLAAYAYNRLRDIVQRFNVPISFVHDPRSAAPVAATPRAAYFGGRTEAMSLRYDCHPDEVLRMCDVSSSYPWSYGSQNIPFGGSYTLSGTVIDPHKFVAELMRTDGQELMCIVNARVSAPTGGDVVPVLPQRTGEKLVFALQHVGADMSGVDFQSEMTGTWTGEDLRCALANGYTVDRIHQVVIFPESAVARGGVWKEYCDVLYRIKSDPARKHLREATKLLLNSPYGRLALRPAESLQVMATDLRSGLEAYKRAFSDENIDVASMSTERTVNDGATVRTFPLIKVYEVSESCVAAGAYVTAHSRRRLYEGFVQVRDHADNTMGTASILYCDTDSILYRCPIATPSMATLGDGLGAFEDDLSGKVATKFVSFGPKTYAISSPASCFKIRAKGVRTAKGGASYPLLNDQGELDSLIAPHDGFILGRSVATPTQMSALMRSHVLALETRWAQARDGYPCPNLAMQEQVSTLLFKGALEKRVSMLSKRCAVTAGKRRPLVQLGANACMLVPFGYQAEEPAPSHQQYEERVVVVDSYGEARTITFCAEEEKAQRQRLHDADNDDAVSDVAGVMEWAESIGAW
jgi:hypothetical protein